VDAPLRRLLRDGLRAVLAELGGVPVVALGPRAARAVEAVLLVDLEERLGAAHAAHLLLVDAQRSHDRGAADGVLLRCADPDLPLVDALAERSRRHLVLLVTRRFPSPPVGPFYGRR